MNDRQLKQYKREITKACYAVAAEAEEKTKKKIEETTTEESAVILKNHKAVKAKEAKKIISNKKKATAKAISTKKITGGEKKKAKITKGKKRKAVEEVDEDEGPVIEILGHSFDKGGKGKPWMKYKHANGVCYQARLQDLESDYPELVHPYLRTKLNRKPYNACLPENKKQDEPQNGNNGNRPENKTQESPQHGKKMQICVHDKYSEGLGYNTETNAKCCGTKCDLEGAQCGRCGAVMVATGKSNPGLTFRATANLPLYCCINRNGRMKCKHVICGRCWRELNSGSPTMIDTVLAVAV